MSATAQTEPQSHDSQLLQPSKHAKRLSQRDIGLMLALDAAGKNMSEIADVLKCHVATVSRTLAQFSDSRELARKRLEGGAIKLAATVVNTKDSGIALKALAKLDVVREDAHGAGTSVLIAIGQPGGELPVSLQPPVIDVTPERNPPFAPALSPPAQAKD